MPKRRKETRGAKPTRRLIKRKRGHVNNAIAQIRIAGIHMDLYQGYRYHAARAAIYKRVLAIKERFGKDESPKDMALRFDIICESVEPKPSKRHRALRRVFSENGFLLTPHLDRKYVAHIEQYLGIEPPKKGRKKQSDNF